MSGRGRDGGGEAPEPMAAEELVSLLYGELEPDEAARTGARIDADPVLSARLGEMRRVRELFSSLEEQEPPGRLTAQLMAEAARAAPQARRAAAPAAEAGWWSRFVSWLQPVLQRPALAAAASLLLVAGVASVLYMRKGEELTSTAPPPGAATGSEVDGNAAVEAAQPAAPSPVTAAPEAAGEDRAGMADGDEAAAPPAEEVAKPDPASTRAEKPVPKRRKAASSAGDKKEKSPARPALKSGTVYGLSEQEMVPREQAQTESGKGGGGAVGGAQTRADDAPAPPPPPQPAPSTSVPPADSKAPAPSKPNVRDLHRRAIDAALDNRCSEVKMLAGQVRANDSAYYAKSVASDQRLQKCLATPKAPAKK